MSNTIQGSTPLKPVARKSATVVENPRTPTEPEGTPDDSPVSRDKMSRLLRYGSIVPVIGGAFETGYGVKEWQLGANKAEKTDGKVDVIRGSSALVGSLANLPIYATTWGLLHAAGPFGVIGLAGLGLIGGAANTLNAIFDGGRDILHGAKEMKAHDPMGRRDMISGSIKLGAGLTVAAGSVLLSPVLLYAGNAIFAGAAIYQNRELVKKFLHKLPDKLHNAEHKVGNAIHHLTHHESKEAAPPVAIEPTPAAIEPTPATAPVPEQPAVAATPEPAPASA